MIFSEFVNTTAISICCHCRLQYPSIFSLTGQVKKPQITRHPHSCLWLMHTEHLNSQNYSCSLDLHTFYASNYHLHILSSKCVPLEVLSLPLVVEVQYYIFSVTGIANSSIKYFVFIMQPLFHRQQNKR